MQEGFNINHWKEQDPDGLAANAPGAKLDAGKPRPGLVIRGFSKAIAAVVEIGTYGAAKYTDNGWERVRNGYDRYYDAQARHQSKHDQGELRDPESMKYHLAHEAWNSLAKLELFLREQDATNRNLGQGG